jgi:hypothetical protein
MGMKSTALIRISVFVSLPALILSIASVIITGGYQQEIKALKAASEDSVVTNAANLALLQEMFTAQNRAVRQAIYEQNRDLAKQIDERAPSHKRAKRIRTSER